MTGSLMDTENVRRLLAFNHNVFSTLFTTILLLFLMENLWMYSVSAYIDVKYILFFTIISGLIDTLFFGDGKKNKQKLKAKDMALALMIAIIGTFMAHYKLSHATSIVNEVSILSGLLLLTIALMFYDLDVKDLIGSKEQRKEKKKTKKNLGDE